jgi:lysophospholipase L1-like esterase
VTFGHSWVAGRYPSRWVRPWPNQAAAALHRKTKNFGKGSALTSDTVASVIAYDPAGSDVVVIETVLNDLRRFGDSEIGLRQYREGTTGMLTHLRSAPEPPRILVAVDPEITAWSSFPPFDRGSPSARAAYLAQAHEIVAPFPGVDCIDLGVGWDPGCHLADDGVHPNAAGTRFLARAVAARLEGEVT